ncbi:hypothetical protein GCM10022245_51710 [Streptomyces mayteni]
MASLMPHPQADVIPTYRAELSPRAAARRSPEEADEHEQPQQGVRAGAGRLPLSATAESGPVVMLWCWAYLCTYEDLDEHVRVDSRQPACRAPPILSSGNWSPASAVRGDWPLPRPARTDPRVRRSRPVHRMPPR